MTRRRSVGNNSYEWIKGEDSYLCPGCGMRISESRPDCGCPGGSPAGEKRPKIDLDDETINTDKGMPF